jgi:5'-phosphate synthase pdxT subunit
MMKIGVLALQGDFAEHKVILKNLNVEPVEVRLPRDLEGLSGLIIPGGESTTIGKLAVAYDLMDPIRDFARSKPIWGTCAGAIFLSKNAKKEQPLLELMNIVVERNAFGAQVDSFEADLDIEEVKKASGDPAPFHAVFIRAPIIESVSGSARVLAKISDGRIVAAIEGHLLATSFHPELTNDVRFHQYFVSLCSKN